MKFTSALVAIAAGSLAVVVAAAPAASDQDEAVKKYSTERCAPNFTGDRSDDCVRATTDCIKDKVADNSGKFKVDATCFTKKYDSLTFAKRKCGAKAKDPDSFKICLGAVEKCLKRPLSRIAGVSSSTKYKLNDDCYENAVGGELGPKEKETAPAEPDFSPELAENICHQRLVQRHSEERWQRCLEAVKVCGLREGHIIEWPQVKYDKPETEACFKSKVPHQGPVADEEPMVRICRSMGARPSIHGPCYETLFNAIKGAASNPPTGFTKCLEYGDSVQQHPHFPVIMSDTLGKMCAARDFKRNMPDDFKDLDKKACVDKLSQLFEPINHCFATEAQAKAKKLQDQKDDAFAEQEKYYQQAEGRFAPLCDKIKPNLGKNSTCLSVVGNGLRAVTSQHKELIQCIGRDNSLESGPNRFQVAQDLCDDANFSKFYQEVQPKHRIPDYDCNYVMQDALKARGAKCYLY